MGIADMINKEDRVEVKFTDFYNLMKEAAKAELLMNGVKTGVHHFDMYAMMTGEEHPGKDGFLKEMEERNNFLAELLSDCCDDCDKCEGCDEEESDCADCDGTPAEENSNREFKSHE